MKVRGGHAIIDGDNTEYEMPSGCLDIISDDGRALFCIRLCERGIEVSASSHIKHERNRLSEAPIEIIPCAPNVVFILRPIYK